MKTKKLLKLCKRECNEQACKGTCPFLNEKAVNGCMLSFPETWNVKKLRKIIKRLKKKK